MKKIILILSLLFCLTAESQVYTPINNYGQSHQRIKTTYNFKIPTSATFTRYTNDSSSGDLQMFIKGDTNYLMYHNGIRWKGLVDSFSTSNDSLFYFKFGVKTFYARVGLHNDTAYFKLNYNNTTTGSNEFYGENEFFNSTFFSNGYGAFRGDAGGGFYVNYDDGGIASYRNLYFPNVRTVGDTVLYKSSPISTTLQQVTDNGNTTTNDITCNQLLALGGNAGFFNDGSLYTYDLANGRQTLSTTGDGNLSLIDKTTNNETFSTQGYGDLGTINKMTGLSVFFVDTAQFKVIKSAIPISYSKLWKLAYDTATGLIVRDTAALSGGTVTAVTATAPLLYTNSTTTPNITADTGRGLNQLATGGDLSKVKDSLGVVIATKGTGTVTSITLGRGLTGSSPITTTGTIGLDTTKAYTWTGATNTFTGQLIQSQTGSDNNFSINSGSGSRFTAMYFKNNNTSTGQFFWDNTNNLLAFTTLSGSGKIGFSGGSGGAGTHLAISSAGAVSMSSLGTGTVYSNAGVLTNTNPSDERLKNTIQDYPFGLDQILQLKPKTYFYNSDSAKANLKYGFLAQDVEKVMPSVVRKLEPDNPDSKLGLESDGIYVAMVKAIQQLTVRVIELENKLKAK